VTLPVAILAGGLATRLRPVTATIPKALVEVAGEPFVAHQLRLLARNGIKRVVLCVGYLGTQITDRVGDGSQFGLHVSYVFDGPKLLGTAGALRKALPELGAGFFVLYGDSYLDCDYRAVEDTWQASQLPALMTVFRNAGQFDTSNVEFANGRIARYSKRTLTPQMQHIDYGLGILQADILADIPPDTVSDLADVYENLARTGRLAAYEATQRFFENGSFSGIADLEQHLKENAR
jgi:NDP-sugar pyrophosphorylase family protein